MRMIHATTSETSEDKRATGGEGGPRRRSALVVCEAHGVEACVVCMIDEFERLRDARRASLRVSRAEVRRERREDGTLPWEAGGEGG